MWPADLDHARRTEEAPPLLSGGDPQGVGAHGLADVAPSPLPDDAAPRRAPGDWQPPHGVGVDAVRDACADQLARVGWFRRSDWLWVKDDQRWALELNVISAIPHFYVQQQTGFHHPIAYAHSKVARTAAWASTARAALRTLLTVLAYPADTPWADTNGLYRLDHLRARRLFLAGARTHGCARACLSGTDNVIWHTPRESLAAVTWEGLRWR